MKQSEALTLLKMGLNVFLTGQAGAGKTYVLNEYIRYLHKAGTKVAVTATTGIAATHLSGSTIHSFCGMGIQYEMTAGQITGILKRNGGSIKERLRGIDVLIIDEISMLHRRQFELIDAILQAARDQNTPFGGVQLVLSGDFFQLPPISQRNEAPRDKFAFMSPSWVNADFTICYLMEQHRQQDAQGLNTVLNAIRAGNVSQEIFDILEQCRVAQADDDITHLYTHNINVDKVNQTKLDALKTRPYEYYATYLGDEQYIHQLKRSMRTPDLLTLKKGAKVMFVKNSANGEFYNGTQGEVTAFATCDEEKLPVVTLTDGRKLLVRYETWELLDDAGDALAECTAIPLTLAWAMSVHKSQGMSLDAAFIDLAGAFENGQGYVALSRVRSLKGLYLLGINARAFMLDPLAMKADQRFLELSKAASHALAKMSPDDISIKQTAFANPRPIATTSKVKTTLSQSIMETMDYLLDAKSIKETALARDLTCETIVRHLETFVQEIPKDDSVGRAMFLDLLIHLAPPVDIIEEVANARKSLFSPDDPVHRKVIFNALEGQISYKDITLSLIFARLM